MQILIRSDASTTLGTGHVMRDLVLAKRFAGHNVSFATRPLLGNLDALIEENGYHVHSLKTNDMEELNTLVRHHAIDLLVIDSYDIDYAFEKALKESHPSLKLMVLDDTYEKHYCDTLLNHNIYAKKSRYKNLVPKKCIVKCGAKYTLLRDEFKIKEAPIRSERLLICMGGADTKNLTLSLLENLPKDFSWHVDIVTTYANAHLAQLQKYIQNRPHMKLHIQTKQLALLAKQARFAIITPSVLANELYALKTPFIAIQSAKNQELMREFLEQKGYPCMQEFSAKGFKKIFKNFLS